MDMDFNLELTRPPIGRASKKLVYAVGRELTSEDINKLNVERGVQKPLPSIKRLSDRHKNLARLLAAGKSDWDAALICGYAATYVSILKTDPAFIELMKIYGEERDIQFKTATEMLAGMSVDALHIIQEHMENDELMEKASLGQKLELAKFVTDRSGNGPQTSNTNINLNVDVGNRLEAARKRLATERAAVIVAPVIETIDYVEVKQ